MPLSVMYGGGQAPTLKVGGIGVGITAVVNPESSHYSEPVGGV